MCYIFKQKKLKEEKTYNAITSFSFLQNFASSSIPSSCITVESTSKVMASAFLHIDLNSFGLPIYLVQFNKWYSKLTNLLSLPRTKLG